MEISAWHFNSTGSNLNNVFHEEGSRQSAKPLQKYPANQRSWFELQNKTGERGNEEDQVKREYLEQDFELEYQEQVNKMFNNQKLTYLLDQDNEGNHNRQSYQEM